MTISCEDIYTEFLMHTDDIQLLVENDKDYAYQMMLQWLKSSISKPFITKLFKDIDLDCESLNIEFNLKHPKDDKLDASFVSNILALGIRIQWMQQKVASTTNINQVFGGKEEKYYSQANHLDSVSGLLRQMKLEQRRLISEYVSNYNSYI